ncbi:type II toxin-antitoxin system PemK/MazF family toxin [Alcaligenes sp. 13f]|uniref:type II toxin-antitoxin system PemK/MazF family toxin n=1 Tax=Alcaligenes sp. 13f TaxID=2841924 RepID=UPI001CF6690E|nr:type II toxin-antitoxin system PemK/MazF family toxin [Alcaligenes sp. 13f]MCB4321905.1 type II toxin-antitoxin system PemK/MazF family toxin [Alcaligenes sp. 13f]
MRRGDLVTVAMQGDFGKPRPALVIQADLFAAHSSVTVLPVTSTIVNAPLLRISIQPDPDNGLQKTSQIMIDKALTVKRDKIGQTFGSVSADTLVEIERCLAVFLGIAK